MINMNKIALILLVIASSIIGLSGCKSILESRGLNPDFEGNEYNLEEKKALIVTTSHGVLNKPGETDGKATGVAASEMTAPYYEFLDANMEVHVASIRGGEIPVDPVSMRRYIRCEADERYLRDDIFQTKVKNSIPIEEVDFTQYDVIFFAGGWGAAYDMGQSDTLAKKVSHAYYNSNAIFGSVCHGALAFVNAKDSTGQSLIKGRTMTGVTQKQLDEINIEFTPLHPEEELRKAGANYQCSTGKRDIFETLTVVDEEKRFVTGQNQNSGHETAQKIMEILNDLK
jgi:putative intracellular protease/amidase